MTPLNLVDCDQTQSQVLIDGYSLTRLTFISPDGSQTEFVDQQTGGKAFGPYGTSCPGGGTGFNRGTVFVATDGSGATFVASSPIIDAVSGAAPAALGLGAPPAGTLYLADGRRYDTDGVFGRVTAIHDSNGNTTTIAYDQLGNFTVTDETGRTTTVTYHTYNSSPIQDKITFAGEGGLTLNPRSIQMGVSTLERRSTDRAHGSVAGLFRCGKTSRNQSHSSSKQL
jgi:YD repeat-containing protein